MTRWRHRTATALLLAAVPLAGLPGVAQAADPLVADACPADEVQGDWFADTAGNVHAQAVECLSWWAVTGGVEQGRYGVGDPVSRGQMATFLARTLDGLGVPLPGAEPRFPDVAGTTHADGISRLAAAGVVGGGADGRYRPGDPVSRAQMATFLVRTFEYANQEPLPPAPDRFRDDTGSVHEGAIDVAAAAGWAGGVGDGRFAPATAVRRDQMASFLARMLGTAVRVLPGGRDAPIPAGEEVPLLDEWVVTVTGAEPDATARVLAENPFNTPPPAGRQYVLVTVRGTYEGGGSSRLDATSRLRLLADSGQTYSTFEDDCGVVPGAIGNGVRFRGGTLEGALCYAVRTADVASLRLYDAEGDTRTRLYGGVLPG